MLCIQRQCPTTYEDSTAAVAKAALKTNYNYVQSKAASGEIIGSASSQEKLLPEIFQEAYMWDQVSQG